MRSRNPTSFLEDPVNHDIGICGVQMVDGRRPPLDFLRAIPDALRHHRRGHRAQSHSACRLQATTDEAIGVCHQRRRRSDHRGVFSGAWRSVSSARRLRRTFLHVFGGNRLVVSGGPAGLSLISPQRRHRGACRWTLEPTRYARRGSSTCSEAAPSTASSITRRPSPSCWLR